jgi:hypothetical protein
LFNIPDLWLDNAVIFTVSIPQLKYHEIFLEFQPITAYAIMSIMCNAHDYIRMEITMLHLKMLSI